MLNFFKKKRVRDYLKDEEFLKEYDQLRDKKKKEVVEEEQSVPMKGVVPAVEKEVETVSGKEVVVLEREEEIEVVEKVISKQYHEEKSDLAAKEIKSESLEKIADAASILDIEIDIPEEIKPEPELEENLVEESISQEELDAEVPAELEERPSPEEELVIEENTNKTIFSSLSNSLAKTKEKIFGKLNRIISANSKIDEDTLEDLEEALYTSDIGVKMTEIIIENIRARVKSEKYENSSELITLIHEEIEKLVKTDDNLARADFSAKPYVILVVGVNGNGKTTTIGKLSNYYKNMGKKVLIAAADTFRAAAIEQLEEWAVRSGADFVKQQMNSDPAAVAYNAYQAALSRGSDVVLIDTAGRLHNKVNLMKELEKITRVLKKLNPDAPHESLLVLDSTTGQNAVSQAKAFNISSGITGLVLTKLDGTAKGGIAIAINQELDLPVKFIGVGEKIEDIQVFNVKEYVRAIFS